MSNNKSVSRDNDSKKLIKFLGSMVQTMNAHGNEIQNAIESINMSCHKQGTKGDAYKSQLSALTEGMKRLVVLYRTVEKRYESAALKLAGGTLESKVLTDLHGYIVFCNDQINSEIRGYKQIISMLRD